ncbi:MAG: hypothetical protein AAB628_02995 [Patescibacteria group bacterium]
MNKFLISTIRLTAVSGALFFVFVNEALAAPILTPVSIQRYSSDTVLLSANVSNEWKNTNVWFEWGIESNPTTATGMTQVWNKGPFETRITNLTPGTTYYFRAAGMESGSIVYSPVSTYILPSGAQTTITNTTNVVNKTNTTNTSNTTNTTSSNNKKESTLAVGGQSASVSGTQKSSGAQGSVTGTSAGGARIQTYETSNEANGASVIGAGSEMFPNTIIGWMLIFVALLAIPLGILTAFDRAEERKRARELEEKQAHDEKPKEEK